MPVPVYLCTGKDCSRSPGHAELAAAIDAAPGLIAGRVRCQKVCKGPVAGFEVDGTLEWFARVRSPKARKAVIRTARDGGPLSDRLRKRRWAKRSGQLRR